MASSLSQKLSREDYRRQKDLEAARKAGTAPAEQDEQGRDINPHIPQYIARAPWYIDTGRPSLTHQRIAPAESLSSQKWYPRGLRVAQTATKYRKGACTNCGAITHKTKDCVERPRKVGARWTNKEIQPDEAIGTPNVSSYDAKRDRWNGYDASDHSKILEEWEMVDNERKRLREKELEKTLRSGNPNEDGKDANILAGFEESSDEEVDEDKYAESSDMVGQKVDTKTRTTVRNLRIREDTAKYLRNLDLSSAYYDPKTRSMRDNPNKDKAPEELTYAGDNFVRYSGGAASMNQLQLFAWEAAERGHDVHLQANPSQAELMYRQYLEKKEKLSEENRNKVMQKYGGQEHLRPAPGQLGQSEEYVEYALTGQVIKGLEKAKVKSRYEEDVLQNNHTEIWGSYWKDGKWGYKCCGSMVKSSFCAGARAEDNAPALQQQNSQQKEESSKTSSKPAPKDSTTQDEPEEDAPAQTFSLGSEWKKADNALAGSKNMIPAGTLQGKNGQAAMRSSGLGFNFGSDHPATYTDSLVARQNVELDQTKLKNELQKEQERLNRSSANKRTAKRDSDSSDDEDTRSGRRGRKKPKYNSAYQQQNMTSAARKEAGDQGDDGSHPLESGQAVTAEELEAYRLLKKHSADPMLNYKDNPDQFS